MQVAGCELPRGVARVGDAVQVERAPGRRIERVALLLVAGGGGGDLVTAAQAALFDQILHDKLGHRRTADVAQAKEQDSRHEYSSRARDEHILA